MNRRSLFHALLATPLLKMWKGSGGVRLQGALHKTDLRHPPTSKIIHDVPGRFWGRSHVLDALPYHKAYAELRSLPLDDKPFPRGTK